MRVATILHNLFGTCRQFVDLRNLHSLFGAIETLTRCRKLTIASLGRSLKRNCLVKHKIKAVDRLFGNLNIQKNVVQFYQKILCSLVGNNQVFIIVDWSGLTHCGKYHFLGAAIPVGGRALPILQIPFEVSDYASQKAHKIFLKQLKDMLPKNSCPIILTDAGFRNPWFKLVTSFGWNYIGRVRNITLCKRIQVGEWECIKSLYSQATGKAQYMGEYWLAKTSPTKTHFYLCKEKKKNRIKRNLAGKKIQCSVSLKHAKREAEPWLLATSLDPREFQAHEIINMYKRRMQIEESFRDIKNERNGLSLRQNRSVAIDRLSVALLIGAMTLFLLWILGFIVKTKNLHYQYQANTIRTRNVLSSFIIGWQALEEGKLKFLKSEINHALRSLREKQYA